MGQILRALCPDLPLGMWDRCTTDDLLEKHQVEIIEKLKTVAPVVVGSNWNPEAKPWWVDQKAEAEAIEAMKSIGFEIEFVD